MPLDVISRLRLGSRVKTRASECNRRLGAADRRENEQQSTEKRQR